LDTADCRSLTQKDSGKRQNQANAGWPIGEYYAMLEYKGEEDELTFSWQNERYSTRLCPIDGCGHHNKIKGRVYKCKKC
jgi:transposase